MYDVKGGRGWECACGAADHYSCLCTGKDEKDVHTEHCCHRHGCKYGNELCTVTTGGKPQSFPCEECHDEIEETIMARRNLRKRLTAKLFSLGLQQVIGDHPHYYAVGVHYELDDEPGRMVDVLLTPEQAESVGRSLIEYAEKVRKANESLEKSRARLEESRQVS